MTIAEALRKAAARLAGTSDTARLDAELLMAHALGISRSELLLRHMGDTPPEDFARLVERRSESEPVAYITGHQEFYGLDLLVTAEVLIPRSDSESTLEAALAAAPDAQRILDCGTGSGALLLAVLSERPAATGIGMDRSLGAMAVAAANAARLGLEERASIHHGDWTVAGWADDLGRFDLIIANPPYVESDAPLARNVMGFEPHDALFSGPDGLADYRSLIPQLRDLLTDDGVAVLEIGAGQADAVAQIAASHGFTSRLARDLADRPRALILR